MSKSDETAASILRAKAPQDEQVLSHSRSVIHWPEIYREKIPYKNRSYTKVRVPVTCGGCRKKRPVQVYGVSRPGPLTLNSLSARPDIYTGLCPDCSVRGQPKVDHLEVEEFEGGYVFWRDVNDDGVRVQCKGCGESRRRSTLYDPNFTGYCHSCGARRSFCIPDHDHPYCGARIFSSRPVRDAKGTYRWPYRCVHCGNEALALPHAINYPKWRGLCSNSQSVAVDPRTLTEDKKLPLTGAPVYLSRRHGKKGELVPVQCVYPVPQNESKICGIEHDAHFKSLRRSWDDFTGYCAKHEIPGGISRRQVYAAIQELQAQAQNGNGQKSITHRPRSDRDEWLLEIIAKVAERWHKYLKAASEPERQDNLSRIKQEYVADDLGLTVTGLRGRLDECGWREMFPEAKKRFPELVAFIAESLDRGETKEEILDTLRSIAVGGAQKS